MQHGQITLAKGYGYADVAQRRPVIAEQTLFRIGSVSKPFTWTVVMQLVEAGKLDLHADVNQYLPTFQIPATYPQPITLHHLLTHSAGFDSPNEGVMARTLGEVQPLEAWLASNMPARVAAPGVRTGYSNYGTALAGYIVRVSQCDLPDARA